jgi:hypothetical protein
VTVDITCAGTFAGVTVFQVERLQLRGYGEGTAVSTLDGNDAVIAARLPATQGPPTRCVLAGRSASDVDAVRSGIPASFSLTTVSARPGPVTAPACPRSHDGSRYWQPTRAAQSLREAVSAACAAVTAECAGAVLVTRIRQHLSAPGHFPEQAGIGAGAAFASGLHEAQRDSKDREAALARAARVVRAWLADRHATAPETAA